MAPRPTLAAAQDDAPRRRRRAPRVVGAGRGAGAGARRAHAQPAPTAGASVDGVLGTLLDLVEVDDGWRPRSRPRPARRWPQWSSTATAVGAPRAGRHSHRRRRRRRRAGARRRAGTRSALRRRCCERPHVRVAAIRSSNGCSTRCSRGVVVVEGGWERALDRGARPARRDRRDPRRRPLLGAGGWRVGAARVAGHRRRARRGPQAAERVAAAIARRAAASTVAGVARSPSSRGADGRGRSRVSSTRTTPRLNAAADGLARSRPRSVTVDTEADALARPPDELAERSSASTRASPSSRRVLPALEADEEADASRARSATR